MVILKMAIFEKVDYVEIEPVLFAIYVDVDIMHRIKEQSIIYNGIIQNQIRLKT